MIAAIFSAQAGKVGINTPAPTENLDVNGKVYANNIFLRNPGDPTESGGTFLASGNEDHTGDSNTPFRLYSTEKQLFNYINLTFENVTNDGILDYNTKIDTDEFVLVVHNYSVKRMNNDTAVCLDFQGYNNRQGSPEMISYKGTDNKWHVRARFTDSKIYNVGSSVNSSDRFKITLYMVAYRYLITKQNIGDITKNLGGTDGSSDSVAAPTNF